MEISSIRIDGDLIEEALSDRLLKNEIEELVMEAFEDKKQQLIENFLDHPVSQEISNPEEGNISGTLGGYGDLFGFIGFFEGSEPIESVQEALSAFVNYKSISIEKSYNRDARGRFTFGRIKKVSLVYSIPTLDDFNAASENDVGWDMPRNWVKGIEKGISGLGRYADYEGRGRSGRGVQLRGTIKEPSVDRGQFLRSFRPVPYMTSLMKGFSKSLENL
jgi:hypothetical protein